MTKTPNAADAWANLLRLGARIDNLFVLAHIDERRHTEHYQHTSALATRIEALEGGAPAEGTPAAGRYPNRGSVSLADGRTFTVELQPDGNFATVDPETDAPFVTTEQADAHTASRAPDNRHHAMTIYRDVTAHGPGKRYAGRCACGWKTSILSDPADVSSDWATHIDDVGVVKGESLEQDVWSWGRNAAIWRSMGGDND